MVTSQFYYEFWLSVEEEGYLEGYRGLFRHIYPLENVD